MIESFLFGVGGKLIANLVNSWLSDGAEAKRNAIHSHKDADWVNAQVELQKEINKDLFAKVTRAIIYVMVTATFCFITVYAMYNPTQTDVLVDVEGGIISKLFRQKAQVVESVHISGVVFKDCLSVMIAVLGAFVTPSRK